MTTLLYVSYASLWLLVVFLLLAVFALARQVGLLHNKLGDTGARMLNDGPEIGDQAPELGAVDLDGRVVTLGSGRGKLSLLVFVLPGCSTCGQLMPAVRALWRSERKSMEVCVVSLADDAKTREFAAGHDLKPIPIISGAAVAQRYEVRMPPYGILVGSDGKVKAKGLVNSLEHLESLVAAVRLGHASIESYMAASRGAPLPPNAATMTADNQLSA